MLRRSRKAFKRLVRRVFAVMYAPMRAWFVREVYDLYLYNSHVRWWVQIKRARVLLRRPALPRPCCRRESNRGPSQRVPNADSRLTINYCKVCGTRHFELVVDPGTMGLKLGE